MVSLHVLCMCVSGQTLTLAAYITIFLAGVATGSGETHIQPPSQRPPHPTASVLPVGGGVELAFLDSGVPPVNNLTPPYTTIFAIHGVAYFSRKEYGQC